MQFPVLYMSDSVPGPVADNRVILTATFHNMSRKRPTKISSLRPPESAEVLTKDELAKRLKLTRRGIECLVARRIIPVIRLSRRCVRFSWEAVQRALAKLEVKEIGR